MSMKENYEKKLPVQLDEWPIEIASHKSKADHVADPQTSHIAVSAYYKAQARGFEPGNELRDWLTAGTEQNQ